MGFDINKTTIGEKIKRIAAYRGYTLNAFRDEVNRVTGSKYKQPTFSRKLIKGAIKYDELEKYGEILGFTVNLELKDVLPIRIK